MVLRSDRRIPPMAAGPGAGGTGSGFTVADVGRLLSRSRNRQGLSLHDVGMRTGIPVEQLRAAETGVLDRPDGLATLKTVRRYADFLGLPGDRFALAILERWPTKGGVHPLTPSAAAGQAAGAGTHHGAQLTGPTAAMPALGPLAVPGEPSYAGGHRRSPWADATKSPALPHGGTGSPAADGRRDDDPTLTIGAAGIVGAAGAAERVPHADAGASPAHWGAYSETGVTPAVRAPADHVRRRQRRRVPVVLQAVVVIVVLAVLAGVALLAIDRLKPSWLRAVGLTRGPTASANAPITTTPGASSAAGPTASPGAGASSSHASKSSAALRPRTARGVTVFTVPASSFDAKITAPGGPCWVDVTTNTSATPAYAGVIPAGGSKTLSHVHALTVELASTTGRLTLTSAGGGVTSYAPRGKYPFHVAVRTSH